MIPADHPAIRDYLAEFPKADDKEACARIFLLDRLYEATGFAAGETGGVTLGDACWWYAKGRDEDEKALRWALAAVDEVISSRLQQLWIGANERTRPAIVREMKEDIWLFVRAASTHPDVQHALQYAAATAFLQMETYGRAEVPQLARDHPAVQASEKHARAATVRDLKHRVLALYPEVRFAIRCPIAEEVFQMFRGNAYEMVMEQLRREVFRFDLGTLDRGRCPVRCEIDHKNRRRVYTQEYAAPDLIPLERDDPKRTASPRVDMR